MPQSNHRKKGGGINEREPSAFIAYTYDSKTMPPSKYKSQMQNANSRRERNRTSLTVPDTPLFLVR